MARVLILEDEESLLKMITGYLARKGHNPLACGSAKSALLQLEKAGGDVIDLLIADVTLGEASGVDVGLEFIATTPEGKVLFISGYPISAWKSSDADSLGLFPHESVRVLQKPFSPKELVAKVNELIGVRPPVRAVVPEVV